MNSLKLAMDWFKSKDWKPFPFQKEVWNNYLKGTGNTNIIGAVIANKDQNNKEENGIYVVRSGDWTRSDDANNSLKLSSASIILVEEGYFNNNTIWRLITPNPIVLGITELFFLRLICKFFSCKGVMRISSSLSKETSEKSWESVRDKQGEGGTFS